MNTDSTNFTNLKKTTALLLLPISSSEKRLLVQKLRIFYKLERGAALVGKSWEKTSITIPPFTDGRYLSPLNKFFRQPRRLDI